MFVYQIPGSYISRRVRKQWSGQFNNMSDKDLFKISLLKRKGIATERALLAQEILWQRNGSSDTSWKEEQFFHKLCEEEAEY